MSYYSGPFISITIGVGHARPAVVSTALSRAEARQLDAWLAEHPDLAELADRAWQLADADDDPSPAETA